jgi:membrane glycosyltransferase
VARIGAGVLLESILSTLIAPLLMVTQTSAVLAILIGRDAGWGAQQRQMGPKATLLRFMDQHHWHMVWGAAGAGVCTAISPAVLAWMSPIITGLLLAAPIALLTARNSGRLTATLLAIQEDLHPPVLLSSAGERSEEQKRHHLDGTHQ